jgi:hypothetical protein
VPSGEGKICPLGAKFTSDSYSRAYSRRIIHGVNPNNFTISSANRKKSDGFQFRSELSEIKGPYLVDLWCDVQIM